MNMAEGGLNVSRSQESISERSGDYELKLQVKYSTRKQNGAAKMTS